MQIDQPILSRTKTLVAQKHNNGLEPYYRSKIEELEIKINEKRQNIRRIEAQRNELNYMVKSLQEEFTELLQPALQIAEVSKVMGKSKCLVKEEHSKKIVEIDSKIDQKELVPNARVALDPTDH